VPNDTIYQWIKDCEIEFRNFSEYFQKCYGVTNLLFDKIMSRHPLLDPVVVKEYLRTRIRIKIRTLNEIRRSAFARKRKAKQFVNSAKLN